MDRFSSGNHRWLATATRQQLIEGALWLQRDARDLYAAAARYRDQMGGGSTGDWLAIKVQANAAHSAALARAAVEALNARSLA